MNWDLITNIILAAAIATALLFAGLAIYQWTTRKSFKRIDPELRWASVPIVLMAATYFIFDKLWVLNTRPDGSGEPSFPSSHVMLVATVFALTALILPRYIKNKAAYISLSILMLILTILTGVGRVLADKHWPSDVAGALIFAAIFATTYYFIIKNLNANPTSSQHNNHKEKNHHA